MPLNRGTLLCHYRYDPLDRLTACAPSVRTSTQRFYLEDRLATEIQGATQCSIMQHEDQLLALQQRQNGAAETTLLATDQQRSVLNALDATQPHPIAYTPYGHRAPGGGLLSLLGFNGERPDPVTGCYLLGNGYRAFNPVLMRFNSPDSWSPFGEGGLNAYAYCTGDPLNRVDNTGHSWALVRTNLKLLAQQAKKIAPSTTAQKMPKTQHMLKRRQIAKGVVSYEDTSEGGRRINFIGHGVKPAPNENSLLTTSEGEWGPLKLFIAAKKQGIDFDSYNNVRILSCYSAEGEANSFAAIFAKLSNKPTKGYYGELLTRHDLALTEHKIPTSQFTIIKRNPFDPLNKKERKNISTFPSDP
ncbi:hypothetical protein HK44_015100 [Pseudomonas fluorescens HK44]|uniref:Teneurin-like YD-shell domain-containing protein n=1 Tax=Pseudomonas fluorescens HK44 TaxID=1042209 RepID=A0A010SG53_PSEFL|nr:RHS repeat-associated core domain-containing protein [Pseudomonas fluorescens]EXF92125.1 hypothetical protein HK44_015100 [Pseudomonas fluorescens HK44]